MPMASCGSMPMPIIPPSLSSRSAGSRYERCPSVCESAVEELEPPRLINHRDFLVSSKGDINASFSVPGLISIPSDGDSHNVTIIQLPLDALMSWISVPKKETKAHLTVGFGIDLKKNYMTDI